MSYIVLSVCWCNTVLNVHAPSEGISDDSKDNFYEELEHVCEYFSKCNMKNYVRKLQCKIVGVNIFNPTIWNKSLHQDSNDSGVRIVNSATSKNLFF